MLPDHPDIVGSYIEKHKPGQRFKVTLTKLVKGRNRGREGEDGNQLGYFFGVIVPTYQHEILFCLTKKEAYHHLLSEFSYEMIASKKGAPMKKWIHVDDAMPMDKMNALIGACLMDASINHGVFIHDPDKNLRKQK